MPGQRVVLKTGISIAIPKGYYGRVAPRSGLAAKHGIDVLAGVIDSGFRGEVGVVLINLSDGPEEPFVVTHGMRIAQLIIERCEEAEWVTVNELAQTVRGSSGYGSSGLDCLAQFNDFNARYTDIHMDVAIKDETL